jgi:hypothetical protein
MMPRSTKVAHILCLCKVHFQCFDTVVFNLYIYELATSLPQTRSNVVGIQLYIFPGTVIKKYHFYGNLLTGEDEYLDKMNILINWAQGCGAQASGFRPQDSSFRRQAPVMGLFNSFYESEVASRDGSVMPLPLMRDAIVDWEAANLKHCSVTAGFGIALSIQVPGDIHFH